MEKKNQKRSFCKNEKVIKIDNIDVNKILVSKKEPYGTKNSFEYFIGYIDDDVIRPLWVKLPQMIGYARSFESNMTMLRLMMTNCWKNTMKYGKKLTVY